MRKLLMMALLMVVSVAMMAQDRKVEGVLEDRDTKEAMEMATVALLKTDSTYVCGTLTKENGLFVLNAPENGKYLLKITSVGYPTTIKKIEIADDHDLNMGKIVMGADAVMLKGVTATAMAAKVTVVEDTFVYNSAAYRTPEGSVVEELIKLLPGAKVDDDGNVTINGKSVKKIKMDGKEFMNGDTKTALKNLPTSIIERVKAYEGKSDRSRITGIEDGEDEMTLDFSIKPGMNKGFLGMVSLGYGTEDRYAERIMGMVMKDRIRVGVFTNFNNVNDRGFGGRGGGFGRGRNGLTTTNDAAANINYEIPDRLKIDGSIRWNHGTTNQWTKSSSESFVIGAQSFSNSISQNYSKNKNWNGQMRLEWTPDSMTNVMIRPSFSWSDNDSRGGSSNATFDTDPYEHTSDPLNNIAIMEALGLAKNSRTGSSLGYGTSKNFNFWGQVNRRLNNRGRNISLNLNGRWSNSENRNFSTQNVKLYQVQDQDYSKNRYNLTPSTNWSYDAQVSYSEPIAEKTYLQFSYKFAHSYSKSDRATYDFSDFSQLSPDYANLLISLGLNSIPVYRNWGEYLLDNYEDFKDENQSRFTEYKTTTQDIEVQFRRVRDKYNLSVGVMAQPQTTHFIQNYLSKEHNATRHVINFTPTADFRYYFTKRHQLRFNYRGRTAQPSMADMVEITDDTDPMNITIGNPDLKPSFTSSFNANYNNFIESHYQTIAAWMGFSSTRNSTARRVVYDQTTGARVTRSENINGNWNAYFGGQYAIAVDSVGRWNLSFEPGYNFSNSVGLVSLNMQSDAQRNITRTHSYNYRQSISFRNSWLNIEPDASIQYTHSLNQLQPDRNLDTWGFSYGANLNITMPWGTSIASDVHMRSRRGYNDDNLNTNELIWNAQISQSFLRARNLSVSLQFYDILKNQSNFSRTIDAMSRRDTENNAINSYIMLTVNYRFNFLGGKAAHEQMGPPPGGGRPDFNREEFRRGGGGGGTRGGRPF